MSIVKRIHTRLTHSATIVTKVSRWTRAKRTLCYVLILALPSQAFFGCAGGKFLGSGRGTKYGYAYTLATPVESPSMLFQDDSLKVQFIIDESAVRFQLQNISSSMMSVRWNRVSLGIDNRYHPVRHSIDFYADSTRPDVTALIPPSGYILETVIPDGNIRFDGSRWVETEFFPTEDRGNETIAKKIARNVGKEIELVLPLQFGVAEKDYRFDFKIVSVTPIAWSDYRPPRRNPPVQPKQALSVGDEITTAFISVGLLGFVAFMVSLKKDPVAE